MNFRTSQEALSAALDRVFPAVARTSALPILKYVRVEAAGDNSLTLTGTDLERTITTRCGGIVETPGVTMVDAALLRQLIKAMPTEPVVGELQTSRLRLSCGSVQAQLGILDPDDFPMLTTPTGEAVAIPGATLLEAITAVSYAAAQKVTAGRATLNGVHIELAGGRLGLTTADSYRLAHFDQALPGSPAASAIIPVKTMTMLAGLIGDTSEVLLRFERSHNTVWFEIGGTSLCSQVIEGSYPDWRRILPSSHDTTVAVSVARVADALRACLIVSKTAASLVRLTIAPPDTLTLSAEGGTDATMVTIPATIEGDALETACNGAYLLETCRALPSEQGLIKIELRKASDPFVLRPASEGDTTQVHVVVPRHIARTL